MARRQKDLDLAFEELKAVEIEDNPKLQFKVGRDTAQVVGEYKAPGNKRVALSVIVKREERKYDGAKLRELRKVHGHSYNKKDREANKTNRSLDTLTAQAQELNMGY